MLVIVFITLCAWTIMLRERERERERREKRRRRKGKRREPLNIFRALIIFRCFRKRLNFKSF